MHTNSWRKLCRIFAYIIFIVDFLFLIGVMIARVLKSAAAKDAVLEWTKFENPELDEGELMAKAEVEWIHLYVYAALSFLDLLVVVILFKGTSQDKDPKQALLYTRVWLVLTVAIAVFNVIVDILLNEFAVTYLLYLFDALIIFLVCGYLRQLYKYQAEGYEKH